MIREEVEGVWHILWKDLRAYYFKPPNVSWGILFPLVLALAFSLRNPGGLADLAPGLVAMAALFGTTSMEAIVITFEKRVGALERLILAPVSLTAIVVGKVLGGAVFGLVIAGVMTGIALAFLSTTILHPLLLVIGLLLTVMAHSALGAVVALSPWAPSWPSRFGRSLKPRPSPTSSGFPWSSSAASSSRWTRCPRPCRSSPTCCP